MNKVRKQRLLRWVMPALAAGLVLPIPQAALAQGAGAARGQGWETAGQSSFLQREISKRAGKDLRGFYAARDFQPLWLNQFGRPSGAASMLMHHLRTAEFDGIDPEAIRFDKLVKTIDKARRGDEDDIAKAEVELSRAFATYVQAMRAAPRDGMIYETRALAPVVPTQEAALQAAADLSGDPAQLEDYISSMRWMHPLYAPLRAAMEDPRFSENQRHQIWTNLARIRAIPAIPRGRHILVDAASARLWMYEDGQVVDSMKVVVGKPDLQTPQMAGFIRQAIINPYWNVPDDLTQKNIASNVIDRGVRYLKAGGYQVFDGWSLDAPLIDPAKIDWHEVAQGRKRIRVRQLPGGSNFMGKVKFEFPNNQGIYLHDTPDKHLLKEDARQLSSGCVRLEDAGRLHKWLMGKPLPAKLRGDPEQAVPLPEMVPIYITYLTARPESGAIAFSDDPYARDGIQLAAVRNDLAVTDRP
jgi:murein L,D-transpeptidase YcbB/YkuD